MLSVIQQFPNQINQQLSNNTSPPSSLVVHLGVPSSTDGSISLHGRTQMLVDPRAPRAVGGLLVHAGVSLEEAAGEGAAG